MSATTFEQTKNTEHRDSKIHPQMTFERLYSNLAKKLNSHGGSQYLYQQHAALGNNSQTTEHSNHRHLPVNQDHSFPNDLTQPGKDPTPDLLPIPLYHQ
jgi:hypothetical protein